MAHGGDRIYIKGHILLFCIVLEKTYVLNFAKLGASHIVK